MRKTRGWTEEQWREAAQALADRGLLTGPGDDAHLTDAGTALKAEAEDRTDAAVAASWAVLSDDQLATLADDAKIIAKLVLSSGAMPTRIFGHGSDAQNG
jgi:ADP-heptose:LPS heptosyltransferase